MDRSDMHVPLQAVRAGDDDEGPIIGHGAAPVPPVAIIAVFGLRRSQLVKVDALMGAGRRAGEGQLSQAHHLASGADGVSFFADVMGGSGLRGVRVILSARDRAAATCLYLGFEAVRQPPRRPRASASRGRPARSRARGPLDS